MILSSLSCCLCLLSLCAFCFSISFLCWSCRFLFFFKLLNLNATQLTDSTALIFKIHSTYVSYVKSLNFSFRRFIFLFFLSFHHCFFFSGFASLFFALLFINGNGFKIQNLIFSSYRCFFFRLTLIKYIKEDFLFVTLSFLVFLSWNFTQRYLKVIKGGKVISIDTIIYSALYVLCLCLGCIALIFIGCTNGLKSSFFPKIENKWFCQKQIGKEVRVFVSVSV